MVWSIYWNSSRVGTGKFLRFAKLGKNSRWSTNGQTMASMGADVRLSGEGKMLAGVSILFSLPPEEGLRSTGRTSSNFLPPFQANGLELP